MMNREKPADLLTDWKLEQLAYERALGQILQHLVFVYQELDAEKLEKRLLKQTVSQLEKRLGDMEKEVARLRIRCGKK